MKAMFVRSMVLACGLQVAAVAQAVWTQVGQSSSPPGRYGHAMAYDSARQRVVMFGGFYTQSLGDTWEWNGTSWVQFAGGPSPRANHAMAYDAARQRVVMFGGGTSTGLLGDTWVWNGASWLLVTASPGPSPRSGHTMAYDSARQLTVLFGGEATGGLLADTWEWNGTTWLQRAPATSPSPRANHAMAYDAARQRVVMFGGRAGPFPPYLADTWEWNGAYWAAVFAANPPTARYGHAITYDNAAQRVVLFGGTVPISSGTATMGDTWIFNGTNWANLMPALSPPPRASHAMAHDSARQRVVLFGGGGFLANDTWVVSVAASATTFGTGCGQPPLGLTPDPAGRPILGQTCSATIVNVPTSATFVAAGSSRQFYGPFPLPVTLASIGMLGCDLYHSAEVLGLGTSPISLATRSFSLAIPNTQPLIGMHIYLQAYAFAPGANPLNVIISNAIDWQLGTG